MNERPMIPVTLEGGEARYFEPSLSRLPAWLEKLADRLGADEDTRDLYMQEVAGLKNWAAIVRELLAQAR